MEAVRVEIRAYTASFRIPGMMSYQITSPVPPPSTVYGLLAAATGREVTPEETWIAYRLTYRAMQEDLEKVIIYDEKGPVWLKAQYEPKTNVLRRQFLFEPHLTLYIQPGVVAEAFLKPRYPLVLGRSQDVAYVENLTHTALEPVQEAEVAGVLLPFPIADPRMKSRLMSFPTFYSVAPGRRPRAVKPFHVIDGLLKNERLSIQKVAVADLFYSEPAYSSLSVPFFDVGRLS
jgi:CRISPR-associated protein Cas5t